MGAAADAVGAYRQGRLTLRALAERLAALPDTRPAPGGDPAAVYGRAEDLPVESPDGWEAVRAARDVGDLSPDEYEQLSSAVDFLQEP